MIAATYRIGAGVVASRCAGHPYGPLPGGRSDYVLARDLGGMTVAELRRRMTVREFMRWAALYMVENQEREAAALRNRK